MNKNNLYKHVSFIKISNNKDCSCFYIDHTRCKDPRFRISGIKSQYKRYLNGEGKWYPIFKYIDNIDWSYSIIDRGCFDCFYDVKCHKLKLHNQQMAKFGHLKPLPRKVGLVTFP